MKRLANRWKQAPLWQRIISLIILSMLIISVMEVWSRMDRVTLTILYTSDLKGRYLPHPATASEIAAGANFEEGQLVGGMVPVIAYVSQLDAQDPDRDTFLLIDAGNALFGSFESNIFQELNECESTSSQTANCEIPMVDLMNALGYNALAVGNRDFEFGASVLADLTDSLTGPAARFKLLSTNVFMDEAFDQPASYLNAYEIFERSGVRIAVIGTLTPMAAQGLIRPSFLEGVYIRPLMATWDIEGGSVTRETVAAARDAGADIVVLIADVEECPVLIEEVSDVDVFIPRHVLGSECSQELHELKTGGRLAPLANGGFSFGRLDVVYDPSLQRIIRVKGKLIWSQQPDIAEFTSRAAVIYEVWQRYHQEVSKLLQEQIGTAEAEISHVLAPVETPLGDLVTDAMRETYGVDVAFINTLAMRNAFPSGPIIRADIYRSLIFDNRVITMKLRGDQILGLIYRNGFQNYRFLQVSGLSARWVTEQDGYPRVVEPQIGGVPLDLEAMYNVATIDFLAEGGDGFVEFRDGTEVQQRERLNEVVAQYIQQHSPVVPSAGERMAFYVDETFTAARQRAAYGLSVLYKEGKVKEGVEALLAAHEMNPQDQAISYELGEAVLYYLSEVSSAESPDPQEQTGSQEWAHTAIEALKGSAYPWAHVTVAKIYLEFRRLEEARQHLLIAREDLRYAAEPNLLLGDIYQLQGECDLAEYYYYPVIQNRNDLRVRAQTGLATCWCTTGQHDRGLSILKAAKLQPFLSSEEIGQIDAVIRTCKD